ncbi:unnamed protein product [Musa banksii]
MRHGLDHIPCPPRFLCGIGRALDSSRSTVFIVLGIYSSLRHHKPRGSMTCDEFPRVCRAGHHCCRKQCVNVMTDNQNCGQCGKKCCFGQVCCGGSCVNVMYDPKNCGGCNKRCKKGSFCQYGMCSYA